VGGTLRLVDALHVGLERAAVTAGLACLRIASRAMGEKAHSHCLLPLPVTCRRRLRGQYERAVGHRCATSRCFCTRVTNFRQQRLLHLFVPGRSSRLRGFQLLFQLASNWLQFAVDLAPPAAAEKVRKHCCQREQGRAAPTKGEYVVVADNRVQPEQHQQAEAAESQSARKGPSRLDSCNASVRR